jgi:type IV secretory pathway protease TraF
VRKEMSLGCESSNLRRSESLDEGSLFILAEEARDLFGAKYFGVPIKFSQLIEKVRYIEIHLFLLIVDEARK